MILQVHRAFQKSTHFLFGKLRKATEEFRVKSKFNGLQFNDNLSICKLISQLLIIEVQCNLDLVTLNLVTTCDLVTIFQRPFFNLLHKIIRFCDIMQFSDSFCGDQKCH